MSQDPLEMRRALAIERWREQVRWRNRWTTLIFALGIVLSLTLIALLIMAATGVGDAAKLGTALSAAVEGVALAWIVRRRSEAVKEEQEMFDEVEEQLRTPEEKAALQVVGEPPTKEVGSGQLWQWFRHLSAGWQLVGWIFAWPVLAVLALWKTKLPAAFKATIVIFVFVILVVASLEAPQTTQPPGPRVCFDQRFGYYQC